MRSPTGLIHDSRFSHDRHHVTTILLRTRMSKIYWLLVLVPVTLAVRYMAPDREILIFALSALSMIPLAKLLSDATEHLAARTGPVFGALLNVTFGNAGELVIGFFALREGLQRVVKASITGSILANLLLTLGISMIAAGARTKTLRFNPLGARTQTTMLALAAISLILPASYALLGGAMAGAGVGDLSLEFSVILLATYGLSLLFTLHTHHHLLTPGKKGEEPKQDEEIWSAPHALIVLALSAIFVGWMAEVLVGSVEVAAKALRMTDLFVGLVIIAVAGNAAESAAAIRAAMRNRMDLSVGIAAGSSIQIALFVAPGLVILSHWVGRAPMDLVFTSIEIIALVLAVAMTSQIAADGESNWLEGVQLLAVYIMLAVMFFYLPESASAEAGR
jgi:Ca2+:H+ antiporter